MHRIELAHDVIPRTNTLNISFIEVNICSNTGHLFVFNSNQFAFQLQIRENWTKHICIFFDNAIFIRIVVFRALMLISNLFYCVICAKIGIFYYLSSHVQPFLGNKSRIMVLTNRADSICFLHMESIVESG